VRVDGQHRNNPIHSRAYCLMTSPEALVKFHKGFDGHVFRSKSGALAGLFSVYNEDERVKLIVAIGVEYQAVVEYAPLQKTPYKAKVKVDARQGTIDDGNCAKIPQ